MKNIHGKKIALMLLLIAAVALCTACSSGGGQGGGSAAEVPVVINQAEYLLYQNIFYNDYGPQYVGQELTKQGVFTTVRDAFNNRDRYYVWGYLDNTRCCDWQWEINVKDTRNLPANGSLVVVKGTFAADGEALDGYWLTNPEISTVTKYAGLTADVDMFTMSDTLERVQVINIINYPEVFEGKSFSAYGRIASTTDLQDPYYDGSWQIPFTAQSDVPSIGTTVVLRGALKTGTLAASTMTVQQ